MRCLLLALVLIGCGPRDENPSIVGLEGARYEWVHFNHRLSHLEFRLSPEAIEASVVGGTSTTGVDAELPPQCNPDECEELPFVDEASVRVDWARVDAPEALAKTVVASLTADADGENTTIQTRFEGASELPLSARIQGFRLSTDHPLDGGEDCYDPAFGWLPTDLELRVGEPMASGDEVTVEVSARFAVGNTLEDFRKCIDDVVDRARIAVELDVLVIAGGGEVAMKGVSGAAAWELGGGAVNPNPQELPAAQKLSLGLDDPLLGWQSMHWQFHVDDPERRGAYLRSLDVQASPKSARGAATNYSPITQLSGFDYQFEGTVIGHELGGVMTRGSVQTTIPVELDPVSGAPVVHAIGEP